MIKTNFNNLFVIIVLHLFLGTAQLNAQESMVQLTKGADTLVVYKDVPGLAPSNKYTIRVKSALTNNQWVDVFAQVTYNRNTELPPDGLGIGGRINWHYQTFTDKWSHTYGNIEMSKNMPVDVEISFINGFTIKGTPIVKAAAHPFQKVSKQPEVINGKIYFTISNPAQVVIDINGQMDDHHAAINPILPLGTPIHTIALYANPIIKKPSLNVSRTYYVEPGADTTITRHLNPASFDTLYFKPGVHNLGINFKIFPNKKYYIPGDAIVYATLNNFGGVAQGLVRAGENIKIYGYGTISNWGIHHPDYVEGYDENEHCPIFITDAMNAQVIGITISDPCFHSLKLQSWSTRPDKKSIETICKWVKIVSWRSNGDGIGSAELVEDCFLRTGDDASYIKGDRLRVVFWRDVHAAAFHMAMIPSPTESAPLRIEDCDVIYNRSRDSIFEDNGAIFHQRGEGLVGQQTVDLKIRDFRNHDKLANSQVFGLKSKVIKSSGTYIGSSYSGIVFENVSIEAESALTSVKQALVGCVEAPWDGGITFDNVTFKGVLLTEANFAKYFDLGGAYPNSFAKNIIFKNSINYTLSLNSDANGTISSNPNVTKYTQGTNVILTANPMPGYEFAGWRGDASGITNPLTIAMDANKSVSAAFQPLTVFTYTTTGQGTWIVPAGVNRIKLSAWGAGGAGGSTFNGSVTAPNYRGGGGAGGSYAAKTLNVATGDVVNFTIGAGGVGAAPGFANASRAESGGNTFASLNNQQEVLALGGQGGENSSAPTAGYNGLGGVASVTGNIGDVVRFGGNGGNAAVGSGCGGGSAGADGDGGVGGIGHTGTPGAAGAGGGAIGGLGTNSTTINPLSGGFPGGGGAGSTIRVNQAADTYKVASSGGNGKFVITTNLSSGLSILTNERISVYPNPATNKLHINANGLIITNIQLIDLTGKVVLSSVKKTDFIDLSSIVSGLYIVKAYTSNGVSTTKIMKK